MSLTKPDPKSTPQVERSLNRQVVLEEEEYTEALSHIIARDFFPSLIHLDATNEYLDALQARDPHLINASVQRLEEISSTPLLSTRRRTQSLTPYGISTETPSRTNGEPERKRARYDKDLSLDTFQARYTSEDNSSFTQILDEENRVRKEKWAWAWEAQKRVEQQQDKMIEKRETMLIELPSTTGVKEKFTIEFPKPAGLITEGSDSDKAEQEIEATTESLPLVPASGKVSKNIASLDVMAPQKDTRSAGVDGWKFKVCFVVLIHPTWYIDHSSSKGS
jgi:protein DGCR14